MIPDVSKNRDWHAWFGLALVLVLLLVAGLAITTRGEHVLVELRGWDEQAVLEMLGPPERETNLTGRLRGGLDVLEPKPAATISDCRHRRLRRVRPWLGGCRPPDRWSQPTNVAELLGSDPNQRRGPPSTHRSVRGRLWVPAKNGLGG